MKYLIVALRKQKSFLVKLITVSLLTIITIKEAHSERRHSSTEQTYRQSQLARGSDLKCGGASFYHRKFSGRKTASGEKYRSDGLTAASWSFRFGERVVVVNPRNGRQVVVRINDRGPARRTKRIIDLSERAFKEIADSRQGIVQVCLRKVI